MKNLGFHLESSRTYVEARLFGFILGDGWISEVKYGNGYRYLQCGFSGDKESLSEVRDDLIGMYGTIGKATLQERSTESPKYGISGTSCQMIANTNVAEHFVKLGMPIGKRVEQEFLLPDWIMNGTEFTKTGFISGFYCAEGYTPTMQKNDKTARPLGFNFHKRAYLKENAEAIAKQFSKILDDIEFEYTLNVTPRVTSEENLRIEFLFSNSNLQVYHQSNKLRLCYSKHKDRALSDISSYYDVKFKHLDWLEMARWETLNNPEKSATEIAEKYGVKREIIYQWRKRKSGVRLPNDFFTLTEFKQRLSLA